MMDTISTESLPKKDKALYRSGTTEEGFVYILVKELAVTKSCEEIVLMTAASIAEIKNQ